MTVIDVTAAIAAYIFIGLGAASAYSRGTSAFSPGGASQMIYCDLPKRVKVIGAIIMALIWPIYALINLGMRLVR